jgi:hypothetical protein
MASADTTSPRAAAAGKPAAKRASTAKRSAASTARKPATGRRAASTTKTRTKANAAPANVGAYAERAVLIPVGAALIARERVASGVNDAITSYTSPTKAQAQLRRFEHRGVTARNRLEREVRKARVRFERELRRRRRELEQTVTDLQERRDSVTKSGADLASRVQERIVSLV